jgi:DNA mismatch repair protein MutS2
MMDDHSLKVLEFYRILEILKEFSISPLGQKRCLALRPSKDLHLIQSRLAEVLELKEILKTLGDIPIRGLKDIEAVLKRLEMEGAVLSVQEIMDIHQQMVLCKGIKRFFLKSEIKAPHLQERVSKLSSLKALEKEILQAINTKGEILDRASPTLSDIRKRLGTVREKAKEVLEDLLHQEELQPIFQEHFITLRNGRYVLLVKFDYKHRLEGIIHDQSQSHMTLFFEPLQAIAFNNEINILIGEEREEEYRILSDLSKKVRDEIQSLWSDFEILGELDLLYAMAKLSILLNGVQPKLSEDGKVDIKEARNPLLTLQKEDQVVPIHLRMRDGVRTLIISGANAGGKTVALKSFGLLTLMVQSGLLLPVAEGSQVAVFEDVFAVIGDEQNIGENLSTFSGHLLHVNQVLKKAGPRSLVLLDELGVGTHAQEGCALAMGFLDQFRESGASVVVTTHFDGLKAYGYLHPDVEDVAVEFDEETLEPKYTLSYGSSGLSNAFLVAEKLGISEKVLEMARRHRDGGAEEVSRALEKLERLKADAEEQRQQVFKIKEEVLQERQRLKDLHERIKRKRREIFSQAEEKARRMAQEVEEELRAWVRKQKEERARFNIHREAIQEIKEKFFPSIRKKRSHTFPSGLKVGERVRIESLRSNGVLLKVEEPLRRAEVMTERAKVKVPLTDIAKAMEGEEKKEKEISMSQPLLRGNVQEVSTQLNVIGLTVEDALPIVDKFIDQALYHGLERVHIIHGIGSGRLRNAIGEYLYGHRGVKNFSPEEVMKGGIGVTVVELR